MCTKFENSPGLLVTLWPLSPVFVLVREAVGLCAKEGDQAQRKADLVVDEMLAEPFVDFPRAIDDLPAGAINVKVCLCGD